MPEAVEIQSSGEAPAKSKPQFGASGRKIIYDKDGKPCRSCNSLLDFQFATTGGEKHKNTTKVNHSKVIPTKATKAEESTEPYKRDIPPDVEVLGRSSWTLLHSIAATYPENPDNKKQQDLKQFLKLFGNFYPCWFCADDFKSYIKENEPKVETQDALGKWLCDAHNEVNLKLGKPKFDCNLWKQRWKDGWEDLK